MIILDVKPTAFRLHFGIFTALGTTMLGLSLIYFQGTFSKKFDLKIGKISHQNSCKMLGLHLNTISVEKS